MAHPARSDPLPALTAATARVPVGASGRQIRVARWDVPGHRTPRAAVLIFGGLSEFIEKYEEVAQDLLARGLLVFSLDWGGQGLSDRPLANRQKIHTTDFDHRLDDIGALLAWAAPRLGSLPVVLLGHSMGGHITLRCASDRPPPGLAAIALSAPMVGIKLVQGWEPLAGPLAGLAQRFGFSESYLPGAADFSEVDMLSRLGSMTADPRRQRFQLGYWRANPELQCGGITWGWIKAALASCARLRQPGVLEKITCPLILGVAGKDILVSARAARRAARRMKACRIVEFPTARHEILMETDDIRDAFFAEFDRLLAGVGLS